jgi:hypothetical protein
VASLSGASFICSKRSLEGVGGAGIFDFSITFFGVMAGNMIISPDIFDESFRKTGIYCQAVYLYLAVRCNSQTMLCNPSHQTILRDLDIGKNTLLKTLRDLVKSGYIERHPGVGKTKTTEYLIGLPGGTITGKKTANRFTTQTQIGLPGGVQNRELIKNNTCPELYESSEQKVWIEAPKINIKGSHEDYISEVRAWLNMAQDTFCEGLKVVYPDVNLRQETKFALAWLEGNKKRRLYIRRYFENWFLKNQRSINTRKDRHND